MTRKYIYLMIWLLHVFNTKFTSIPNLQNLQLALKIVKQEIYI